MTTEATRTPELLSIGEVALALRLARPTIYRLVAVGSLPAVRVGGGDKGSLRVTRTALATYLEERSTTK